MPAPGFLSSPRLGLSAAALFWSGNFVIGRALGNSVSPLSLNYWRWMIALAIILPFSFALIKAHHRLVLANWKLVSLLGITGIAGYQSFVYQALVTTSAINALLLFSMTPLLIIAGSWLVFGDRISLLQACGVVLSVLGALVLITQGSVQALLSLTFSDGDLWMLLAVLMWVIYSLLLKRRPPELPLFALLIASIIAALIFMSPLYLWSLYHKQQSLPLTSTTLASLFYVAVFASILAFIFWNYGVSKIGPGKAGTFLYLMPVFGSLLAIVFLDETMQLFQLAGATLVLSGIVFMNKASD